MLPVFYVAALFRIFGFYFIKCKLVSEWAYRLSTMPSVMCHLSCVVCQVEPVSGVFRAPQEGSLEFSWDNSFSWITPKKLTYCIEVKQVQRGAGRAERPVT